MVVHQLLTARRRVLADDHALRHSVGALLHHHDAVVVVGAVALDVSRVAQADQVRHGLGGGLPRRAGCCRLRRCGRGAVSLAAADQAPEQQHDQHKDDDERHGHDLAGADLVVALLKHRVCDIRVGQGTHQLGHGLHPLGGVQPQRAGQHLREPCRHTRLEAVRRLEAVPYFALGRGDGRLPCDHPVADRGQRVNIGVAPAELGGRVLLRRGVARVELALQLAAAGAQRQRAVTGQAGRAVDGQHDVVRADAAVDQPRLVQQGHALHDGLQQCAGLGGGQRAAAQMQVMRQGHALLALLHGVDRVVFLHNVQNRGQAGGRGQVFQVIVQVLEVHPARLEQDLLLLLGHQRTVGAAAIAECDREIFLDEDEFLFVVQHAAVGKTVTVGAQISAHRVPAAQLGAQRQRALGVAVFQRAPAVGALAAVPAIQRLQAVRAKEFWHSNAPFQLKTCL